MPISIDEPGPTLSEEVVAACEQTLPGPRPADYRSFLPTSNGRWPGSNWWPRSAATGYFDVDNSTPHPYAGARRRPELNPGGSLS